MPSHVTRQNGYCGNTRRSMSRLSHFRNFIQTLTISKKDYETHKKCTLTGSINIFFQRTFTTIFSIANITFIIFSKRVITLSNVSYRGERLPIITGCIPTGDSINFDLKRFYTRGNAGLRHISTIMPISTINQKKSKCSTINKYNHYH